MTKHDQSIELQLSAFSGVLHTWSSEDVAQIKQEHRVKLLLARLRTVFDAVSLPAFAWLFFGCIALGALAFSLASLTLQAEGSSITLKEVENLFSVVLNSSLLFGVTGCLFWSYMKSLYLMRNELSAYKKLLYALLYDSLGDEFYINNLREIKRVLLSPATSPFMEISAFFNENSIPFKTLNDEVLNLRIQRIPSITEAKKKTEAQ